MMSHPAAADGVAAVMSQAMDAMATSKQFAANNRVSAHGHPLIFERLYPHDDKVVAWRVNAAHELVQNVDGVMLLWRVETLDEDLQTELASTSSALADLMNAVRRQTFEIPNGPGVCLPYLFIPDDGKRQRVIETTFRLRAHPDIAVWLSDRPRSRRPDGFVVDTEIAS
jgi:hypothetical protein